MRRRRFKHIDVFTRTPFCGNPAAVVTDTQGMDAAQMQAIAHEMNLSETTFVLPVPAPGADYYVRIFTPRSELPFAGHPTIATVHAVIEEGKLFNGGVPDLIRQQCGIGIIPIDVEKKADGLFFLMTQSEPRYIQVDVSPRTCAEMLGCGTENLFDLPAEVVSTGVKWLIVPLRSLGSAKELKPDLALIEKVCREIGALGITVFSLEAEGEGCAVHARTFAPGEGISEDPVCGSGQGSIAAYIAKHTLMPGSRFEYQAEQGLEVQRPGTVTVRAEMEASGKWTIRVGGQAITVVEGEILL